MRIRPSSSAGVLVSHPTLNANARALVTALARSGSLAELHTAADLSQLVGLTRSIPRLARQFERRALPPEVAARTRSHPGYELLRVSGAKVPALRSALSGFSVHGLYAFLDRRTARRVSRGLDAVVAYEDGAQFTFEAAVRHGVPRYYDLPIPYWRTKHAILEEEADANPAWASLLGGLDDPAEVLDRKSVELALADTVLTASSLSTHSVLAAAPGKRVLQIGYGCAAPVDQVRYSTGGPLRVLYAGGLTQRKGLSYLFEGVAQLGDQVVLTVVGTGAAQHVPALRDALAQHRHVPSLPHAALLHLMHDHDVLVLPSLVEGYGLVINEALSQGIPVITTNHTGASDIYGEAHQWWIVPPRDAVAIADRLQTLASDVDVLNAAKDAAVALARAHPWSNYLDRIEEEFRSPLARR